MTDVTQGDAFARVDQSGDPAAFVQYLDAVAALEAAKAYKQRTYELLRLKAGDRVIDIGCGAGDDVRAIAELVGETGRALGIDVSENMVAEARRRAHGRSRAEFAIGDVHRLDYADGAFDASRVDRALQHVADPERALTELVRVVRSGGRIVASEPDWETIVVDADDVALTRTILGVLVRGHVNPWIGRRLFPSLRSRGILELSVSGFTATGTAFEIADALLGLATAARTAREQGAIGAVEETRWLDSLRDRSREGRFFAAITVFVVAGTKP